MHVLQTLIPMMIPFSFVNINLSQHVLRTNWANAISTKFSEHKSASTFPKQQIEETAFVNNRQNNSFEAFANG